MVLRVPRAIGKLSLAAATRRCALKSAQTRPVGGRDLSLARSGTAGYICGGVTEVDSSQLAVVRGHGGHGPPYVRGE